MNRVAARYLYTLDREEPIRNGFVEYDATGAVTATGVCPDPRKEERFLDGALVPGFVNAHCHIELSYLKGLFRKGTGMAGFIDQINALRDTRTQEQKLDSIRHWMGVLWDRGVSAMADISNCADSFAIKQASPMYTRTFLEVFGTEPEDCEPVMDRVSELHRTAASFGLDAAPTPHACYTMSPELLTASAREGLKSGYLSFHSQESQEEEEMLKYGSGRLWRNRKDAGMSVPPVTGKSSLLYFLDRLAQAGQAPFGEHILLVHEVCLDQEGIDALRKMLLRPFIALCPQSNLFIHNALPPIPLMRANGLELTVGTDALSSNDDLDMVRELYCIQEHFPEIGLSEMLGWACLNGAEFLSKASVLGSIEAGKRPGLVYIDHLAADGRLTAESTSHRIV
jgi:cytosine/adenosine deaminase-related metal-dependent hydrolase